MLEKRRLDGIYIRVQHPITDEWESRCLTDCTEEQREEWMKTLGPEQLKTVAQHLAGELRRVGDHINLVAPEPEE